MSRVSSALTIGRSLVNTPLQPGCEAAVVIELRRCRRIGADDGLGSPAAWLDVNSRWLAIQLRESPTFHVAWEVVETRRAAPARVDVRDELARLRVCLGALRAGCERPPVGALTPTPLEEIEPAVFGSLAEVVAYVGGSSWRAQRRQAAISACSTVRAGPDAGAASKGNPCPRPRTQPDAASPSCSVTCSGTPRIGFGAGGHDWPS